MNRYNPIYKKVSEELGYPIEVVKFVYSSAWDFVLKKVRDIGIESSLTYDLFRDLKTAFFFPHLGRLMINYNKIKKWRRREIWLKYNLENVRNKEDKTPVHVDSDDNG